MGDARADLGRPLSLADTHPPQIEDERQGALLARRWGHRRIYVCSQPDRVYVRFRIGLLSAPLPAIAAASRRALFFLLLYLPTLGARMGLLGSLAPLRTLDFGFAAGFGALLLGAGLAS